MSFSRSKYSSLKDAFGVSSFQHEIKTSEYKVEQPIEQEVIALPNSYEKFDEEPISCEKVEKHCRSCSCQKYHNFGKNMFAEFLNFLLICILIWILVYKPRS